MKLICFAILFTTAQCGFWGSSSGFLGIAKINDVPVEEPLSKIAEKAEAEAWHLFTKQRNNKTLETKNVTESRTSSTKEAIDRPQIAQRRISSREAKLIT